MTRTASFDVREQSGHSLKSSLKVSVYWQTQFEMGRCMERVGLYDKDSFI